MLEKHIQTQNHDDWLLKILDRISKHRIIMIDDTLQYLADFLAYLAWGKSLGITALVSRRILLRAPIDQQDRASSKNDLSLPPGESWGGIFQTYLNACTSVP